MLQAALSRHGHGSRHYRAQAGRRGHRKHGLKLFEAQEQERTGSPENFTTTSAKLALLSVAVAYVAASLRKTGVKWKRQRRNLEILADTHPVA
jgi:hypothetical protein